MAYDGITVAAVTDELNRKWLRINKKDKLKEN